MKISTVLFDRDGLIVEHKMLEVDRPPFMTYFLAADTPEQLAAALEFAREFYLHHHHHHDEPKAIN